MSAVWSGVYANVSVVVQPAPITTNPFGIPVFCSTDSDLGSDASSARSPCRTRSRLVSVSFANSAEVAATRSLRLRLRASTSCTSRSRPARPRTS